MSGATDLIGLIDLSLGEKPSGVVNFNYLHSLLHEIVRRLGIFEEQQQIGTLSALNLHQINSTKMVPESSVTIPDHGPSEISLPQGVVGGAEMESVDSTPAHTQVTHQQSMGGETDSTPKQLTPIHQQQQQPGGDSSLTGRPSSTAGVRSSSSRLKRHQSGIVSAANDLGFLERKLQELETRVNTMETLPELLERKGSDTNATPVRDMWNFTSLSNRVGSVESGVDKVNEWVDEGLFTSQVLHNSMLAASILPS